MLRPIACLKENPSMKVSDFIDATSATWKTNLLQQWFLPMEIETIKSIPLSTHRMDGRWAWHYEKSGIMMVCLVYRLLVQMKKRREDWLEGRAAGSDSEGENKSCVPLDTSA
jgi:hypothetical protein